MIIAYRNSRLLHKFSLSAPLKPFTVATLHYQLVDNTKLPTADM